MLRLVIYDITSPGRLRKAAKVCEDFGIRVQKSVFECWLDKDRFEALWSALLAEIRADSDSLVAYTLDTAASRQRRFAGKNTEITEKRTRLIL
jgi:CRISPR-associated protein Cas2